MTKIWIGLITALIGCVAVSSSIGNRIEQNIGTALLYKLRGPITPPPQVAMVYFDGNTAAQLNLPDAIKHWPRSVHACVLKKLKAAGATTVVYDIAFLEPHPKAVHPKEICSEIPVGSNADNAFINTVKDFGSVILLEKNELEGFRTDDSGFAFTRTLTPFDELSEAAAATAPFVLPHPTLGRLNTFWTYQCHRNYINGENDCQKKIANLPVVALQLYSSHNNNEKTKKQVPMKAFALPYDKILNFYGPPRTIPCRSYQSILKPELRDEFCKNIDFAGKVVFIGQAGYGHPSIPDRYHTVYLGNDGLGLAGVEIQATAFANLLTEISLRRPNVFYTLLIVSCFGITLGFLGRMFAPLAAISFGVLAACAYTMIAYIVFIHHYLVLPIISPTLIQAPLAILLGSLLHYHYERIRRQTLQRITSYYVPESEIDQSINSPPPTGFVYGVCLATDMKDSTVLAEKLGPKNFETLITAYYEIIANLVKQHDGLLLDIAGDGTMSVWQANNRESSSACSQACTAAIDIMAALEHFKSTLDIPIHTRIGLHAGEFTLNFVRVGDRYFYKATGDTVHIASRIEQLNKELNTQILASQSAVENAGQFLLKPCGLFTLRGLSKRIQIIEIRGKCDEAIGQ